MKSPHDIILEPVISEKSYTAAEVSNAYTFVVAPNASKPEISDAIEALFGVTVKKVTTLNRKGKRVRNRRSNTISSRPTTKRAVVTLGEGDEIDIYQN